MALQLQLSSADAVTAATDALAVIVTQGPLNQQPALVKLDEALGGELLNYAKSAEFEGKPEQCLDVTTLGRIKAKRVLLVGAGPKQDMQAARLRAAVASATRTAQGLSAKHLGLMLPELELSYRAVGEAVGFGAYRFTKYFTADRRPKTELAKVTIFAQQKASVKDKKALELGYEIAKAVALSRDAINEPPNELFPEALAAVCRQVARDYKLKLKVLDKKGILAAGMKLHYAVGQGSSNEPRFIHMTYSPKKKARAKLAFVGKGLTFDAGGLCIKPAAGMGDMKDDMSGAAAVVGLMAAVAKLEPDVEVHGIIGAAENMPDGSAYRPGDVFGSLDGKTVEIINTDAEGRLVLADALTYASRLKPDLIVDAATLTGACMVALGKTCSAFYTSEDGLASRLETAAYEAGENFWRMPLLDELSEQLKSDIADLKHTGDRWGGSITAALFLREFVGKVPWIHCDIAGPVLADRARGIYPKGGTGHPVLTFLRFVEMS